MHTSIFVYLAQLILSLQYLTVLSDIADFPHIVELYWAPVGQGLIHFGDLE